MPRKGTKRRMRAASTNGQPHGSIGERTFQQVEQLVGKGLTKTDAIKQVAKESSRSPNTVTQTYYRLARKRRAGRTAVVGRRPTAIAGRGSNLLREIAAVVRDQEKELATLRQQAAATARMRAMLKML